jgi:hypothetical protein
MMLCVCDCVVNKKYKCLQIYHYFIASVSAECISWPQNMQEQVECN